MLIELINIRVFILFTQHDFINYTLDLSHRFYDCMHNFQRVADEVPVPEVATNNLGCNDGS